MNFNNDLFFFPTQGVKGALGDPGLPGPTGIRGGFGERVSDVTRDFNEACVT